MGLVRAGREAGRKCLDVGKGEMGKRASLMEEVRWRRWEEENLREGAGA